MVNQDMEENNQNGFRKEVYGRFVLRTLAPPPPSASDSPFIGSTLQHSEHTTVYGELKPLGLIAEEADNTVKFVLFCFFSSLYLLS